MRVLVIGGGGREHAIVWKIVQSSRVTNIFCAPGNPGIATLAECVPIQADNIQDLLSFAQDQAIDLTIVGPEAPLADGIADHFRQARLRIFGPGRMAARIETSKVFAKDLMRRSGIPTPSAETFTNVIRAQEYLRRHNMPVVIKADGLAQGKGVVVATTLAEAQKAVTDLLEQNVLGASGATIMIEEFVAGDELSVMALTDGNTVVPLLASRDYKRIFDNDQGPNTGGMGSFAPVDSVDTALMNRILNEILQPIVDALSSLGSPYRGVLYAGIMLASDGPKVLECNARFGDPETQVVLSLLKTDLVDLLGAVVDHQLDALSPIEWHEGAAVCVVLASGNYPSRPNVGKIIHGVAKAENIDDVNVFHAGTKIGDMGLMTAGGRVLGVTATSTDHRGARAKAYEAVAHIIFDDMQYRRDICHKGVET
ncbi:MAG: phosphoribosylamine--glycine ligase [Nitrospiraceae bacterium]|nr:phosphoribosylamine--glycine ligase [Nitrospiraceae bacterium]